MMGGGIGVELPLVRWIGRRVPIEICQDLWKGNDYLMSYAKLAVDNMKASRGNTNIFANMMAEAEKGEKLDDLDVQVEAQSLIVAGTDTTSITLTYLLWAVLSEPELQRQLEDEVKRLPDHFRDSDAEKLELLNAIIEETLRLYGAAPGGLPRTVPPGGCTMKDIFIPAGSIVTTQAYTYHRDASLFPDSLK
jgi:cytochrome P450